MNTKSSIFMSGKATSENTAFCVHEWNKKWSYTEKVKFSISFMLEYCSYSVYFNASVHRTETQFFSKPLCVKFDAYSVFIGYAIGCKHSLQLKNSSKLLLKKQISRNLLRKNAYGRPRRPDVTCFNNIKLALFIMSLMSWWHVNMCDVILGQAG